MDRAGPGRTADALAALTEMRLTGLEEGSTRLHFARGRTDQLDMALARAEEIDTKFWEILQGIETNVRPSWATNLVAETARKIVAALQQSAAEVQWVRPGGFGQQVPTKDLRRDVWDPSSNAAVGSTVVVTGTLEAVDLRNGRFRIADDVGHRIALVDVPAPTTVAHLVNRRVRAEGSAIRRDGPLRSINSPSIEVEVLPESWRSGQAEAWQEALSKPGPTYEDGMELTDKEFADFIGYISS